jgi:ditrans,polycis-polyprenyl diphosphate synthase
VLNSGQILEICYKAGVTHVTIYAFSIENFKRSKYEVDALMDMAKIKLTQLSQHGHLMDQYGASIRILGQRELVKPDVLKAVDEAVELTSRNSSAVLNICFPYTSRDEITTAIRRTVDEWSKPLPKRTTGCAFKEDRIAQNIRNQNRHSGDDTQTYLHPPKSIVSPSSSSTSLSSDGDSVHEPPSSISSSTTLHQPASPRLLATDLKDPLPTPLQHPASRTVQHSTHYPSPEAITSSTLTSQMFTAGNPPIDLLVRTSSVHRLSDFMLWQCHQHTEIAFLDVLWPQFDSWTFLPVLWEWQWRQKKLQSDDQAGKGPRESSRSNSWVGSEMKKAGGKIDG